MPLSDADYIKWLKSGPARFPCMLAESKCKSGGVEVTRYFASVGYTAKPTDANANRKYIGVLTGGCVTTAQLNLNGNGSMATSSMELTNLNGELDSYLSDIWVSRSTKLYFGDMRWPTTDFRLVFDGINGQMAASARDTLVLPFMDKLRRLDTAMSEHKLGGGSSNAERLIPWALGEMHNVTPLLMDFATLKYGWNVGVMERVIEPRDNGVVIATTDTLASGYSVLTRRPFGLVTGSIQGAKFGGVYVNTVSKIVQALAQNFGQDPYSGGDLDAANLAAFETANPYPVGRWVPETQNVLALMQEFAQSVNAQVLPNELGLLQLIKIALPAAGTSTLVTESRMRDGTFMPIGDPPEVIAASKIGYDKNWTVQDTLDTGIPVAHKELYKLEWLTTTASDAGVATDYKITKEPDQRNTLLQRKVDADIIAAADLALWGTQRRIYAYEGEPELMLEPLGGPQTIKVPRFGFNAGKDAQILFIQRDWMNVKPTFHVLA